MSAALGRQKAIVIAERALIAYVLLQWREKKEQGCGKFVYYCAKQFFNLAKFVLNSAMSRSLMMAPATCASSVLLPRNSLKTGNFLTESGWGYPGGTMSKNVAISCPVGPGVTRPPCATSPVATSTPTSAAPPRQKESSRISPFNCPHSRIRAPFNSRSPRSSVRSVPPTRCASCRTPSLRTPDCSQDHCPSFNSQANRLRAIREPGGRRRDSCDPKKPAVNHARIAAPAARSHDSLAKIQ